MPIDPHFTSARGYAPRIGDLPLADQKAVQAWLALDRRKDRREASRIKTEIYRKANARIPLSKAEQTILHLAKVKRYDRRCGVWQNRRKKYSHALPHIVGGMQNV